MVGELEQTFGEGGMPTTRADVTVNGADLPPLTAEQIARLEALAARPDPEIDYSDIPPLSDAFWTQAVRGRYHRRIAAPKPGEFVAALHHLGLDRVGVAPLTAGP